MLGDDFLRFFGSAVNLGCSERVGDHDRACAAWVLGTHSEGCAWVHGSHCEIGCMDNIVRVCRCTDHIQIGCKSSHLW